MIQREIKNILSEIVGGGVSLERPDNPTFGDLSSNYALKNSESPIETAEKIAKSFPDHQLIEKIEVAPPGFINFYLSDRYYLEKLEEILKDDYGKNDINKDSRILIEFGQPNTHKLPHIGHFRSYSLGESIARILDLSGAEIIRANYQGDVGLHVAKTLWGYRDLEMEEKPTLSENIRQLQKAYVHGSQKYERSEKEIQDLNKKIYQKDESIKDLWEQTRQWSLDYYKLLNKRLGINYDKEYFESQTAKTGKEIVQENMGSVFEESKSAIVFKGEQYDLHTRVFITSEGNPTYETKDLGLIFLKEEDFDFDRSLISTAVEQTEYFKVVYKAAELIAPKLAKKFEHIPFGMVSLVGSKMSSRKGNILSIDELLGRTEEGLISLMENKEYSEDQIERTKDILTIGATKYSILKSSARKNMVFDIEKSVSFDGDSGPYLQYTYARAQSILSKTESENYTSKELNKQERRLLKQLSFFSSAVERSAENIDPSLVCNYLIDLSQAFNSFYETCPVLKAKNKNFRLALVKATSQTLKRGLYLLGIETLETI